MINAPQWDLNPGDLNLPVMSPLRQPPLCFDTELYSTISRWSPQDRFENRRLRRSTSSAADAVWIVLSWRQRQRVHLQLATGRRSIGRSANNTILNFDK